MSYICAFLVALFANVDAFVVGLSYGIKNIKINNTNNFIIAIISFFGTLFSMIFGNFLSNFFSNQVSNGIGGILLIGIAIFTLVKSFKENSNKEDCLTCKYQDMINNPEQMDIDSSGFIDVKESLLIGFILTINNAGIGISASITNLPLIFTCICTFLLSIFSIVIGYFLGKKYLSKKLGDYSLLIACILLIILGIYQMYF